MTRACGISIPEGNVSEVRPLAGFEAFFLEAAAERKETDTKGNQSICQNDFDNTFINQSVTLIKTGCVTPEARKRQLMGMVRSLPSDSVPERTAAWACVGIKAVYLYRYLIELKDFRVSLSREDIPAGAGTFMAEGTKRKCYAKLQEIKAISSSRRVRVGTWQGMEFTLDPEMKAAFLELFGQFETTQAGQRRECPKYQAESTERKIKEKKPSSVLITARDILKHPENRFWTERGLNELKILQWAEEFGLDLETMDVYLKWAAYDISRLRIIRKPMNWFYKCLKISGFYQRPEGYLSPEERQRLKASLPRESEPVPCAIADVNDGPVIPQLEQPKECLENEVDVVLGQGESNELYCSALKMIPRSFSPFSRQTLMRTFIRSMLRERHAEVDKNCGIG